MERTEPIGSGRTTATTTVSPLGDVPFACLWSDGIGAGTRPVLPGDDDVDVCVIGAGFTGLWTAWHLKQSDPSLRVTVLDANHVGFGASGRNGGWVQTALPSTIVELARSHGPSVAMAVHRAMTDAVAGIGSFAAAHAPNASFVHQGQLQVARSPAQVDRLRTYVREHHEVGMTDHDVRWLGPSETADLLKVSEAKGAYFTPHCAAVHPRRLVEALAVACEGVGVRVVENTRALTIRPRQVTTRDGNVRAAFVVRATEGYTSELPGLRRALLPVFSLMIATEPLAESVWRQIGWSSRFTFSDARNMVIYAQRTDDDRIAFGGRGAPYQFGSKSTDAFADNVFAHRRLRDSLVELFPVLSTARITHRWGGVLGVARDWQPSVGLNRSTGMAWAGGYVGDGVGATYLAGQTLSDLILGRQTEATRLPWVNHRSRNWEPEPLRIIGVRAAARLTASVDAAEDVDRRPRIRSWLLDQLL